MKILLDTHILLWALSDAMPISAKELAEYCEQSGFQRLPIIRRKYDFCYT